MNLQIEVKLKTHCYYNQLSLNLPNLCFTKQDFAFKPIKSPAIQINERVAYLIILINLRAVYLKIEI